MRGKNLKSMLLTAMLIVSMMAIFGATPKASAVVLPHMYVEPPMKKYETDVFCFYNGTTFKVEVKVADVVACYGADLWLYYNSTLLEKVGGFDIHGPFPSGNSPIRPDPATYPGGYSFTELSTPGIVKVSLTAVYAVVNPAGWYGFNGTGAVGAITFKIIYCPPQIIGEPQQNNTVTSVLGLSESKVKIWTVLPGPPPTFVAVARGLCVNGTYKYTTIGKVPGAPIANFVWSPGVPYACDEVTLTSTSTPNGGAITAYKWVITNGTGGAHLTGPDNTQSTTMHCDGAGTVDVTLTVWDDEGLNGTVTKTIEQLERIGCILDVYTSPGRFCGQTTPYVGKGTNENADAFAPGVNMTVYVEVTYNGAPINHLLVAIEVLWEYEELPDQSVIPHNSSITYRTVETDKDGIASFQMRIPLPVCVGNFPFGKWLIIASAKVQSVEQKDYLRFHVNYILRIHEAWTTFGGMPETTFYRYCEYMDVHIVVKNIAWIWKEVVIAIVAFDECEVPIGSCLVPWMVPPGVYCHPSYTTIDIADILHIPQWAFIGAGWVYINLFTRLPKDCGIAYCPEKALPILIKLGPRP